MQPVKPKSFTMDHEEKKQNIPTPEQIQQTLLRHKASAIKRYVDGFEHWMTKMHGDQWKNKPNPISWYGKKMPELIENYLWIKWKYFKEDDFENEDEQKEALNESTDAFNNGCGQLFIEIIKEEINKMKGDGM